MLKALEILFEIILEKCIYALGIIPENFNLYAVVLLFSYMFGIFMLMYISFRMEKNKLFYGFFFSIGILALWLYADLKKYLSFSPEEIMFWIRVEYFARMFSAPVWFALSEAYISRLDKFRKKPFILILVFFSFLYVAVGLELGTSGILASKTPIPSFPSYYLGYFITYSVILYSIFRLNRFAFRNKGVYIKQVRLVTDGILLIFLLDMATVFNIFKSTVDIVPYAILAYELLLWKGITRYRLLEVVPIALREIFNIMDDAVVVLNEDGSIIDLNRSAGNYMRDYYNPRVDVSITDIIKNMSAHMDNADELSKSVRELVKNPGSRFHKEIYLCSDAPIYFEVSAGPILDSKQRLVGHIINFNNVTEYKLLLIKNEEQNALLHDQNEELEAQKEELEAQKDELESAYRELQEAQSQLIQSEKMAALGNLVAGVAHEINTPLGSINSNLDIVRLLTDKLSKTAEGYNDDELLKLADKYAKVNEINIIACRRILEIVRSLKNFSRLDEAEFQKANIHDGLDSTLILINNQIKNRITIHKNYGSVPDIECYPNQLNQVFMNLLVNAAQAIEGTGDIYINTCSGSGTVTIEIIDSGKGIKPENLQRIFDPGFTTKGMGVGTGLGLSICYKIIEKHSGRIYADNAEGLGAKFVIRLPISKTIENQQIRLGV